MSEEKTDKTLGTFWSSNVVFFIGDHLTKRHFDNTVSFVSPEQYSQQRSLLSCIVYHREKKVYHPGQDVVYHPGQDHPQPLHSSARERCHCLCIFPLVFFTTFTFHLVYLFCWFFHRISIQGRPPSSTTTRSTRPSSSSRYFDYNHSA